MAKKLTIAGRQAIPSGGPSAFQVSPSIGQRSSAEMQRFANTLKSLGGDWAELSMNAQSSQIRQEIAQAQMDYESQMDDFLLEQEKNPDVASWPLNTREKHNGIVSNIVSTMRTGRAKEEFGLWVNDYENKLHFKVASRSARIIAENERKGIQLVMENAAKHDRREDFEQQLDAMVKGNILLPAEREEWLKRYDDQFAINEVLNLIEIQEFEQAKQRIRGVPDAELRRTLRATLQGAEAAAEREKAAALKEARERTYAKLFADFHDKVLTDPQVVTDAVRDGLITVEAGKYLHEALLKKTPAVTSSAAHIAVRYAIRAVGENKMSIEEALEIVAKYTSEISKEDNEQFVKDIFAAEKGIPDINWRTKSWDYISSQIMSVSSMTGILYGSGMQLALTAQAHIEFERRLAEAAAKDKPIEGSDMYLLAHEVMLPFRDQVEPLIELPEGDKTSGGVPRTLRISRVPSDPNALEKDLIENPDKFKTDSAKDKNSKIPAILSRFPEFEGPDLTKKPESVGQFEAILRLFVDEADAKKYYDKWADEVYKE